MPLRELKMLKIGETVFVPAAKGGLRVAKIEDLDTKSEVARVYWYENPIKRRKEVKFEFIEHVAASAGEAVSSLWEAAKPNKTEALTEAPRTKTETEANIGAEIKSLIRIQAESHVRAQAENQVRAQVEGLVRTEIAAQMRSLAEAQYREQAGALERESRATSTPSSAPPFEPSAPLALIESSDEEFYPPDVDVDLRSDLDGSVNVDRWTNKTRTFLRGLVGIVFFCAVVLLAGKLVSNLKY